LPLVLVLPLVPRVACTALRGVVQGMDAL